jgi:HAE1 family hydrophobic/amphiphilic exporter-1
MKGGDVVEFGDQLQKAVDAYNGSSESKGYAMRVSASFAPSIRQQISELQKTLLEGLLAVLVIGSIVIAVRASVITVLSMVTVIFATLGVLELIGYTLNTISLFALILSLSLIVDDTIIVVEALDAQRKRKNAPI